MSEIRPSTSLFTCFTAGAFIPSAPSPQNPTQSSSPPRYLHSEKQTHAGGDDSSHEPLSLFFVACVVRTLSVGNLVRTPGHTEDLILTRVRNFYPTLSFFSLFSLSVLSPLFTVFLFIVNLCVLFQHYLVLVSKLSLYLDICHLFEWTSSLCFNMINLYISISIISLYIDIIYLYEWTLSISKVGHYQSLYLATLSIATN